jgi:uncharacterized protein
MKQEKSSMMNKAYLFDSYAIIEITQGNSNYKPYKGAICITTKLNMFEVFYSILKQYGEEKSTLILNKYYPTVIEYGKEIIKEAALLKVKHKKQKLSMADCIGYIIAKRYHVPFLTGDKEFEGMDNVEYVK